MSDLGPVDLPSEEERKPEFAWMERDEMGIFELLHLLLRELLSTPMIPLRRIVVVVEAGVRASSSKS